MAERTKRLVLWFRGLRRTRRKQRVLALDVAAPRIRKAAGLPPIARAPAAGRAAPHNINIAIWSVLPIARRSGGESLVAGRANAGNDDKSVKSAAAFLVPA